jgi:hypothetical protein
MSFLLATRRVAFARETLDAALKLARPFQHAINVAHARRDDAALSVALADAEPVDNVVTLASRYYCDAVRTLVAMRA